MPVSISSLSSKLISELPQPIAASFREVYKQESPHAMREYCWTTLSVFLRYIAALTLSLYFRQSEKDPAIESRLKVLKNPSNGHYLEIVREILRGWQGNKEHFFSDAVSWIFHKGRYNDNYNQLEKLVATRNHGVHGIQLTAYEIRQIEDDIISHLEQVLFQCKWIRKYKLFRVSNTKTVKKGYLGKLSSYMNAGEGSVGNNQEFWKPRLLENTVYLSNIKGEQILELTPLVHYLEQRSDYLYLFESTPKMKYLNLRCDKLGKERSLRPVIDDLQGDISFIEWLERREELAKIWHNETTSPFSSSSIDEIGNVLQNRFEIREVLGSGGMAVVYRCFDREYEKEFALKLLPMTSVDTNDRTRMQREFKKLEKLSGHDNIINVHSPTLLDDGRYFFCMEIMQSTLKNRLEIGPIPQPELEMITISLLSALDHIHKHDVIHRDIKPSNILIDKDGLLHLADFGVSYQESEVGLTHTNQNAPGTKEYMAPEGGRGTKSTDRYSLAVTLHELKTGTLNRQPGKNIDGEYGTFLRQLGHTNPSERLKAVWPLKSQDNHTSTPLPTTPQESSVSANEDKNQTDTPKHFPPTKGLKWFLFAAIFLALINVGNMLYTNNKANSAIKKLGFEAKPYCNLIVFNANGIDGNAQMHSDYIAAGVTNMKIEVHRERWKDEHPFATSTIMVINPKHRANAEKLAKFLPGKQNITSSSGYSFNQIRDLALFVGKDVVLK